MKKLLIAALLAGQVAPAAAAGFSPSRETDAGAFAGFRLRVPLDGNAQQRRVRAGLTVAPTLRTLDLHGERRMQIGEGLELGVTGPQPVTLSLAGRPVSQLARGGEGPEGRKAGVSTLGWVAIGVGAVIVVGLAAGYLWLDDAIDCDDDEECN
ncbi:MAG: hypothetical protein M3177_00480 [Pseudomonadota bacterium]|nr:hypothetical protein [Pseudomonadota bacterium]